MKILRYLHMNAAKLKDIDLEQEAEALRILGHPTRLKIICALMDQDLCVSDIENCLGEPQPKISQHLALLRARGIVRAEREGKNIKYKVVDPFVIGIMKMLKRGKLKTLKL